MSFIHRFAPSTCNRINVIFGLHLN